MAKAQRREIKEAVSRIAEAARASDGAYRTLEELCDDIGMRLSGSRSLKRAVSWAAKRLRAEGHESVRTEKVMVPLWHRGAESLQLIEPRADRLEMIGLGGSVGTGSDGVTAEVIVIKDEADLHNKSDLVRGKIVLFNPKMPAYHEDLGSGYRDVARYRMHGARLAAAHGAVATLVRSVTATSLNTAHTGAMFYRDAVKKIPAAAVTLEVAEMLWRLQRRRKRVVASLKMEARDGGMVESANVIAELRGREDPQQIVVIGAHLDSWDVGQGAHDNGAGVAIAMQSLSILRKLALIPRRTIRLVLWTNEENGLEGARQYARKYATMLERHFAAVETDSGGFYPLGFNVDHADSATGDAIVRQLQADADLFSSVAELRFRRGETGADLSPLKASGVPLFGLRVEGARYFDYHHSAADTLDKVDSGELSRATAAFAAFAYYLAERKVPLRGGEGSTPSRKQINHRDASGE